MRKTYVLEKQIDGEWYVEGRYSEDSLKALVYASFFLGRHAGIVTSVRIREEEKEEKL